MAYNVNIIGTKEQAHRIALNIRSAGRGSNQARYFMNISRLLVLFIKYVVFMCAVIGQLPRSHVETRL